MLDRYETFTRLISTINRSIQRIKAEEMAEFELKSSHVSCLYYLYKANSLTARDLCEMCGEDKANISRSIKYLEEHGFLICATSAQKRYLSALELTEKGREVGKKLAEKADTIIDEASAGLPDCDREVMYRSLALISTNLYKISSQYKE